ncbi:MAG: protein translocase subunit SecF [Gemmatimonadota bacterium]
MRLFKDAKYDFIGPRRRAYILSASLVAVGIVAMVVNFATMGSWLRYGVDFTGGTLVQVRVAEGVTDGMLRNALGGAQAPAITRFGSDSEFLIRTELEEGVAAEEVGQRVRAQLEASPEIGAVEVSRSEFVSAKIGSELGARAATAILISFFLTLVYLGFRFEVRFGWAAIVATAHDLLVTLGFLALFRVEISLSTVAAVLTVIGYSLNDTIIVFDRIRENLSKKGARRENPVELINRSINEVIPRTVLTSGTTLAVLTALLILGGAVIRDFTIVLILGIVVGTYSSIFVAAPALLEIQRRWGTKEEAQRKKELKRPRGKEAVSV